MFISVQDDLYKIIDELRSRGYYVYNFSDKKASDIYIFSQKISGLVNIYNSITPRDDGAFLLNIDGMSIGEIVDSINRRTYTPLF